MNRQIYTYPSSRDVKRALRTLCEGGIPLRCIEIYTGTPPALIVRGTDQVLALAQTLLDETQDVAAAAGVG